MFSENKLVSSENMDTKLQKNFRVLIIKNVCEQTTHAQNKDK